MSTPCKDPTTNPASYLQKLKSAIETLRAVPTRPPSRPHPYVSEALSSASHVFVRHDAVKTPLQQPYDGPYKVFKRESKYFTLDIKGRQDTVSIDRLKPAHLDCQTDIVSPPPTTTSPPPSTELPRVCYSAAPTPPLLHRAPKSPTVLPRTTRSGRRVHWPKHFTNFVPQRWHWRGSNVADRTLTLRRPFTRHYIRPHAVVILAIL